MIPTILHNVPFTLSSREDLIKEKQLYLLSALRSYKSNAFNIDLQKEFYDLASSDIEGKTTSYLGEASGYLPCVETFSTVRKRKIVDPHSQLAVPYKRARPDGSHSNESIEFAAHGRHKKILRSTKPVKQVSENDVLSGRGGATNVHVGNRFFRSLIDAHREKYLRAKKNDKPEISRSIVSIIRRRNGAFLKKDESSGLFFEIGDDLAREKTSQALRQRAPDHRRRMMEEDRRKFSRLSSTMSKNTNFNSLIPEPTGFALDHQSLAREYLVVKEKQAELQYHLQVVEELKHRLAVGKSIFKT